MHRPNRQRYRPSSKSTLRRGGRPGGQTKAAPIMRPPGTVRTVPGPAELILELVSLAGREFSAGRPRRAAALLRLVSRAASHPGTTWRRLGQSYFGLADYEAAGRAFGNAAAFRPRDAALQATLARTCLALSDLPAFEGYLSRALALDAEEPLVLELVAEVNRDHGDPVLAAELFARLLRTRPRHRAYRHSMASCCLRLGPGVTLLNLLPRPRTDLSAASATCAGGGPPEWFGARRSRSRPGGAEAGTFPP